MADIQMAPAVGSDAVPDLTPKEAGGITSVVAGGSAKDSVAGKKSETVKLTHLFKHETILRCIMKFCPYIWVKLKMTNRLFIWRLDEARFAETIQWLNHELNLTQCNPHAKAAEGAIDIIWLLLIQGYNPRSKDHEGNTLLQKAVHSNRRQLVQLVLEKGANVNIKGAFGYTALHECSYLGYSSICQLLLAYKANPDALSRNGSTPLLVAAREGHVDLVGLLLSANAHPDDGGERWTPLFIAAGEGHKNIVELLLQFGASATEPCDERLPYHEALQGEHFEVAMTLSKVTPQHLLGSAGPSLAVQAAAARQQQMQPAVPGWPVGVAMMRGPGGAGMPVPGSMTDEERAVRLENGEPARLSQMTANLLDAVKVGEEEHGLGDFETQLQHFFAMEADEFEAQAPVVKETLLAARQLHEVMPRLPPQEQHVLNVLLPMPPPNADELAGRVPPYPGYVGMGAMVVAEDEDIPEGGGGGSGSASSSGSASVGGSATPAADMAGDDTAAEAEAVSLSDKKPAAEEGEPPVVEVELPEDS